MHVYVCVCGKCISKYLCILKKLKIVMIAPSVIVTIEATKDILFCKSLHVFVCMNVCVSFHFGEIEAAHKSILNVVTSKVD